MVSDTAIDPLTIKAYLETEYHVFGRNAVTLRVGVACPRLHELHKTYNVSCSTFVTPCNPFSQMLGDTENSARCVALASALERQGTPFIDGIGQHPSNEWPGEKSFLVFGLSLEGAKALGKQLDQNAIIWNGADAIPELILLR